MGMLTAELVAIGFAFGVLAVMLMFPIARWKLKRKQRIQAGWKEEFREGLEAAIEDLPVTYCKVVAREPLKVGQAVYMDLPPGGTEGPTEPGEERSVPKVSGFHG